MCDVAHESEEQIPGQMNVEDYPELLPNQEKPISISTTLKTMMLSNNKKMLSISLNP